MAIKCSDIQTAPVCPEHHREVDGINSGKETFAEKYHIDWRKIRLHLLTGYILERKGDIEDVRDILIEALEKFIEREG
jgi:hypothetical protein